MFTKGKLRVEGNVYIKGEQGPIVAVTSPVSGYPIEKQKANAKELVRRWNAFEAGGIVDKLTKRLEKDIEFLEAAIASVEA